VLVEARNPHVSAPAELILAAVAEESSEADQSGTEDVVQVDFFSKICVLLFLFVHLLCLNPRIAQLKRKTREKKSKTLARFGVFF